MDKINDYLEVEQKWLAVNSNTPNGWQIILAICTALGAWGGMPEPPRLFNSFVRSEYAQYLLVWVLIYQGGGGANWKLSLLITSLLFVTKKILD